MPFISERNNGHAALPPAGSIADFHPKPGTGECSWLPARTAFGHHLADIASLHLILRANAEKRVSHRIYREGTLHASVSDVVAELEELGYRTLRWSEPGRTVALVHERGYVDIDYSGYDRGSSPIRITTIDEDHAIKLRERLVSWVQPDDRTGVMYALQSCHGELELQSIGTGGIALRRVNYGADVVKKFDHVVGDLESASPCGRLVLFTGPPGTGKTYLVRGLLDAVKRARFIVLQPSDVRTFLEASPLATLTEFVRDRGKGLPIVIVIEDADGCMLPRGVDTMSEISALLNLTDGLIGAAFDVRVIATTNAKRIESDPAITRAGRLCRHVDVPALAPDYANEILAGLPGGETPTRFSKPVTLAEVYAAARNGDDT